MGKRILDHSIERVIQAEMQDFFFGQKRREMMDAKRYYLVQNDILSKERNVIGESGRLQRAENISDNRLAHGFFRELVDQKTAYLFGKAFSIQAPEEILGKLEMIFDSRFAALLSSLARDAISSGIAWLYLYRDSRGKIRFHKCAPQQMIPLWKDEAHRELEGMIRVYEIEVIEGQNKKSLRKVEYWHGNGVEYFEAKGGALKHKSSSPHMIWRDGEGENGMNWEKLPFIAFRYNEAEKSLLCEIKSLIDDYDRIASNESNAIEDQPNSILVLRNYDGQDLGEFRRNLASYRAVKVSDDGGVTTLNTPIDPAAVQSHLERLRRDIYAFGRGVDIRSERFAKASSGVALKQAYAALDMDCNGLETRFQAALRELLGFVRDLTQVDGETWNADEVEFLFNRDIMINEEAAIDMCQKSRGIVSDETIIANHPWVRKLGAEKERLAEAEAEND